MDTNFKIQGLNELLPLKKLILSFYRIINVLQCFQVRISKKYYLIEVIN